MQRFIFHVFLLLSIFSSTYKLLLRFRWFLLEDLLLLRSFLCLGRLRFLNRLGSWCFFRGLWLRRRGFLLRMFGCFSKGETRCEGFSCKLSYCSGEHGPN